MNKQETPEHNEPMKTCHMKQGTNQNMTHEQGEHMTRSHEEQDCENYTK